MKLSQQQIADASGVYEILAIDKIGVDNIELRDAEKRRTVELEVENRGLNMDSSPSEKTTFTIHLEKKGPYEF